MSHHCQESDLKKTIISYDYRSQDGLIVIENVPAWICEVCGEVSFEADVVQTLNEIVDAGNPVRFDSIPVFDLATFEESKKLAESHSKG